MSKVNKEQIEQKDIQRYFSRVDRLTSRKDLKRCPVCTEKLQKNSKGTRYKNNCSLCHAVLAKELTCSHCNTNRLWRGSKGIYCHGCGHKKI